MKLHESSSEKTQMNDAVSCIRYAKTFCELCEQLTVDCSHPNHRRRQSLALNRLVFACIVKSSSDLGKQMITNRRLNRYRSFRRRSLFYESLLRLFVMDFP